MPAWHGRGATIRMALRWVTYLNGRRWLPSYREMADDLGCCPRTVKRWVKDLSEAGVVVPPQRGDR